MTPRPLRRAGAVWRVLVHHHPTDAVASDMAFHVQSDRVRDRDDTEHSKTMVLPHTEFDELVVGKGLIHIEAMDNGVWWMTVGGVVLWVTADRAGRPTSVTVYGPGDYDDPMEDVKYELTWSAE